VSLCRYQPSLDAGFDHVLVVDNVPRESLSRVRLAKGASEIEDGFERWQAALSVALRRPVSLVRLKSCCIYSPTLGTSRLHNQTICGDPQKATS
jgi:hypothetical protein